MDVFEVRDQLKLCDKEIEFSNEYFKARGKYAQARIALDQLLAVKSAEFRKKRANVGYEMSLIMLMEIGGEEIGKYYSDLRTYEAQYKGLEKILEAVGHKISYYQSIMKYIKEGGG